MKKAISLLCMLTVFSLVAQAQQPVYVTGGPPPKNVKNESGDSKINLTVFGGYFFAETFQLYNGGNVYLNDGGLYGASLSFSSDPRVEFELTCHHQIPKPE